MQYQDCVDRLSKHVFQKGIHYGLSSIIQALEKVGNPHHHLPSVIHVSGTNGKGSVVEYCRSIGVEMGLTVGVYTSPHILSYTERMMVNHNAISEETFCLLFKTYDYLLQEGLTEFEFLTVMAFCFFASQKLDFIILETGLGGRLDATNVVNSDLSIITDISLDHQSFLGETIAEIALEKAGIIKANQCCLTSTHQHHDALSVIRAQCKERKTKLIEVSPLNQLPPDSSMQGQHQLTNAALAQTAMKQLFSTVSEQGIRKGIQQAMIWGRFTIFKQANQTVVIDAAHNTQGINNLLVNLERFFPNQSKTFICGFNKTKNYRDMIQPLLTEMAPFYYCEFDQQWAVSFQHIQEMFGPRVLEYKLGQLFPEASLLVITGSIYFLAEIKKGAHI